MRLSKSDYKVGSDCPSKLFFKKKNYPSKLADNPYLGFLADGGYMVEKMAKLIFPNGLEMESWDNPVTAFEESSFLIKKEHSVTMFEPTILHNGRLARVDILNKTGNVIELIEVKSASIDMGNLENGSPFRGKRGNLVSSRKPYLEDITYQYQILSDAFPDYEIRPILCMIDKSKKATSETTYDRFRLNERTPRDGQKSWAPDVQYLGNIDSLRDNHLLAFVNVRLEVEELSDEVSQKTSSFLASINGKNISRIPSELSSKCKRCEYRTVPQKGQLTGFQECWGLLANQDPHILDLYRIDSIGGRNRNIVGELAEQGKSSITDIPTDLLTSAYSGRQLQQLDSLKTGEWMASDLETTLQRHPKPLHFIDFEASRTALPYHKGMSPYELAAFQWSCHTLNQENEIAQHDEWLNNEDAFPNFDFARSLRDKIGDTGTVYVWSSYEISTLKEIRRQMDKYGKKDRDLADWLDWMTEPNNPRIVDMLKIAAESYIHPSMKGSLSIKDVLPAVWHSNKKLRQRSEFRKYDKPDEKGIPQNPYDTLPALPIGAGEEEVVKEGTGAMRVYQEMMFGLSANNPEIKNKYRTLLLQYCELDTAAMVMIWRHWSRII